MISSDSDLGFSLALDRVSAELHNVLGDSVDDALVAATEAYRFQQQVTALVLEMSSVLVERIAATYPRKIVKKVAPVVLAGDMLAKQIGVSCRRAQHITELGAAAAGPLDLAHEALSRGELDLPKFEVLHRKTKILDDTASHRVQEEVLPGAFTKPARAFSDTVSRRVHAADPEAAEKRAAEVRRRRNAEFHLEDDGQAVLLLRGPVHEIRAAFHCLCQQAKQLPRDERTIGNKTFDIAIDRLTGADIGHKLARTMVNVNVELTTLLGLDNKPGSIEGGGPVAASVLRAIAKDENSWLRRIVTDEHRQLVGITDKYRLTPKQRAQAQLRDKTCAVPGCHHPATACDIDHGNPYRATGITDLDDMAALCRRHHLMKHLGLLTWRRRGNAIEFHYRTRPGDIELAHMEE